MSVLDKFLNAMKMNDDEGFDEEYLDDEYDDSYEEYEEERPKKRLLSKSYDDDYEDAPKQQTAAALEYTAPVSKPKTKQTKSAKISPMRPKRTSGGMEVCVIRPKSMEDARESVDISGDFQEIFSGAFEVPTFGTRF